MPEYDNDLRHPGTEYCDPCSATYSAAQRTAARRLRRRAVHERLEVAPRESPSNGPALDSKYGSTRARARPARQLLSRSHVVSMPCVEYGAVDFAQVRQLAWTGPGTRARVDKAGWRCWEDASPRREEPLPTPGRPGAPHDRETGSGSARPVGRTERCRLVGPHRLYPRRSDGRAAPQGRGQFTHQRRHLDDDHWGKGQGTARTGTLVEAGQAFIEEALAPQADHVASGGEGGRILVRAVAVGRGQDDARPQYAKIWQRILASAVLEDLAFIA